jgi:hypothetical protein
LRGLADIRRLILSARDSVQCSTLKLALSLRFRTVL